MLTAVKNCRYAFQFASEELQKDAEIYGLVVKDDDYFYHIVDPCTGRRFDIPMMSTNDPDYKSRYIYNMKLRESSPDTFEKMLSWD